MSSSQFDEAMAWQWLPVGQQPTVTFNPSVGQAVTVLLDASSPVLSGGYGGWETVDRPKRVSMTRFKGPAPFAQDIAVMFDSWIDGDSVEYDIMNLEHMAEQPGALEEPPKVTLGGMALRKDLTWIITDLTFSDTVVIWDFATNGVPVRLRQAVVVHLLQYVTDDVILTPAAPAVTPGKKKTRKIVAPGGGGGMTLKQISQVVYGTPDKFYIIAETNPPVSKLNPGRDPVPAGTHLSIPDLNGGFPTMWIVP